MSSVLIRDISLPKEGETLNIDISYNGDVWQKVKGEWEHFDKPAEQIDQPWRECSCYRCKHRGTAPYEKPCSVCARNHKDYFEEI